MTTTSPLSPGRGPAAGSAVGGAPPAAARVYDAVKVYGRGDNAVRALDGVSVEFATGRFTAIMGPSGLGQVDVAAHRRRPRPPHVGQGAHR